jgi:hypothetical protein
MVSGYHHIPFTGVQQNLPEFVQQALHTALKDSMESCRAGMVLAVGGLSQYG